MRFFAITQGGAPKGEAEEKNKIIKILFAFFRFSEDAFAIKALCHFNESAYNFVLIDRKLKNCWEHRKRGGLRLCNLI